MVGASLETCVFWFMKTPRKHLVFVCLCVCLFFDLWVYRFLGENKGRPARKWFPFETNPKCTSIPRSKWSLSFGQEGSLVQGELEGWLLPSLVQTRGTEPFARLPGVLFPPLQMVIKRSLRCVCVCVCVAVCRFLSRLKSFGAASSGAL